MNQSESSVPAHSKRPSQWGFARSPLMISVCAAVIAADQLSKLAILRSLSVGEFVPVIPDFFNLTLTFNYGAAFGLWGWLQGWYRPVVLGVTILLALGMVRFLQRHPHYQRPLPQAALAAILGGAVGNIVDRLHRGAVVDFLDVYYGTYHWPAFNVADSAICVGVFLLIFTPKFETRPSGVVNSTTTKTNQEVDGQ